MKWRFSLTVNPAMKDLREWQSHHSDADESDGGGSCGCKDGSFGGSDQCIIHGYEKRQGKIRIFCRISENQFFMEVSDKGKGILNVEEAMQLCIRQNRKKIVPGWDLRLWKHLWMR